MVEYDTAAGEAFRVFTARHEDGRPRAGLHALGGRRTAIAQEQLEHAALAGCSEHDNVLKDNAPLPALLQAGMRLAQIQHPGRARNRPARPVAASAVADPGSCPGNGPRHASGPG